MQGPSLLVFQLSMERLVKNFSLEFSFYTMKRVFNTSLIEKKKTHQKWPIILGLILLNKNQKSEPDLLFIYLLFIYLCIQIHIFTFLGLSEELDWFSCSGKHLPFHTSPD